MLVRVMIPVRLDLIQIQLRPYLQRSLSSPFVCHQDFIVYVLSLVLLVYPRLRHLPAMLGLRQLVKGVELIHALHLYPWRQDTAITERCALISLLVVDGIGLL